MMTPYGVRMIFMGGPNLVVEEPATHFRSYFSFMPVEFANSFPFNTGVEPPAILEESVQSFFYSYFSLMPLSYANWYPMITVLLAIAILILLLIRLKKDTKTLVCLLSIGCILASALSWLLFSAYSIVGIIILALFVVICILQAEKKTS